MVAHHSDSDALAKATGLTESLAGEVSTLKKSVETLTTERDDLQKKFDAMPATPKDGKLVVVDKADDINGDVKKLASEGGEVEKVQTGMGESADDAATQIKKIYAGGGRKVFA